MNVGTKLAGFILTSLVPLISPEIRLIIENFVKDLYVRAKQTDNKIDDIVVGIIATVLSIDVE